MLPYNGGVVGGSGGGAGSVSRLDTPQSLLSFAYIKMSFGTSCVCCEI